MTTSGGESAGSSAPGPFLQTAQALLEEAFTPLRDDLPGQVQPLSDLFILHSLCGEEGDFGTYDIAIR
jgi:hypothetical protein